MGVVGWYCGAASGEREGDLEREDAPSGALLSVSIECLGIAEMRMMVAWSV